MAMSGTVMGDAVVTALQGIDPSLTTDQVTQLRTAWEAIAGAIVAHIQSSAVVSASGADPQGGNVSSTGTVA